MAGLATAVLPWPSFGQTARPLRVGVTAGPHAQLMEVAAKVAARDGLEIKIIEFSDYIQPNAALAQGDLDANSYQHQPFLDQQIKDRGYKIVSIAQTVVFPIGMYSRKYKALKDLPAGGKVALPNDPTNGGRVLLLLQREGLIKLRSDAGLRATPIDVTDNPKRLRLIELDAAQLPRSLDDVDAAAINTNFAIQAGLSPTRDAIAMESADSPYANVIAVRESDRTRPEIQLLVRSYRSPEVKAFIEQQFKGSLVPTW
ncbi:MAG TPA: MetQ/NlpA family ABC transporter substrate-binding protein [Alphaproteobacteria bacterium]|nr:MetQ/NlpA family ABC transporter substrate-binding protein [Alphaproteobacteria bacterium]